MNGASTNGASTSRSLNASPSSRMSSAMDAREALIPYNPPDWAADLKYIPRYRVNVSTLCLLYTV